MLFFSSVLMTSHRSPQEILADSSEIALLFYIEHDYVDTRIHPLVMNWLKENRPDTFKKAELILTFK